MHSRLADRIAFRRVSYTTPHRSCVLSAMPQCSPLEVHIALPYLHRHHIDNHLPVGVYRRQNHVTGARGLQRGLYPLRALEYYARRDLLIIPVKR